ncbi:MAG: hypothetical protein WBI07_14465 [Mobilitalea sp.]
MSRTNAGMVLTYSVFHFIIDFSCAFLIYQFVYGADQWYLYLLLYNFCAFALQMPIGLIADKWNHNALCAAIGCVLVAFAYGFSASLLAIVIVAGIGNAMFHIGGGITVLNLSEKKAGALGLFVSPGAFGIYLGTVLGKQEVLAYGIPILVLLAAAGILLVLHFKKVKAFLSNNHEVSFEGVNSSKVLMTVGCLFTVVCLRSYAGMLMKFPWKAEGYWSITLICAVVLGKMSGGLIADRIGFRKASILSLGLAAVLFLISGYPLAGIAAVLLFNMTMPITLWAIAKNLASAKGFAFGILTLGLFLGSIPTLLDIEMKGNVMITLSILSILSILLLEVGLKKVAEV